MFRNYGLLQVTLFALFIILAPLALGAEPSITPRPKPTVTVVSLGVVLPVVTPMVSIDPCGGQRND